MSTKNTILPLGTLSLAQVTALGDEIYALQGYTIIPIDIASMWEIICQVSDGNYPASPAAVAYCKDLVFYSRQRVLALLGL